MSERLANARAYGLIRASNAVEARIAELIAAGHDEYAAAVMAFEEASPEREKTTVAMERTANAMTLNRALGVQRRGGRLPGQPFPSALEVDYASSIVTFLAPIRRDFTDSAREIVRLLASSNARYHSDADEPLKASRILQVSREKFEVATKSRDLGRLARYFGERTNRQQRAALAKQLSRGLGIEVIPDDRFVPQLVDYFAHENASLIGSIPNRLHDDVSALVMRAFSKRMNPDTLAKLLAERFDVAESRAKLIARDQLGSLYGQLNQVRQKALGIRHFFWDTRRDNRVRPDHRLRQGRRYEWDKMNPDQIPGAPIACRCSAIPDLSEIKALAAKAKKKARR